MYGSTPLSNDLNLPYPAAAVADRHQRHQQQISSGLLRYRSAPSTLLGDLCEDFLPVRPSSPETDTLFARFLGPDLRSEIEDKHDERRSHFAPPPPPPPPTTAAMEAGDAAAAAAAHQQMFYHSQQQQMPSQSSAEGSYRMAVEAEQMKTAAAGGGGGSGGNCSNLIRQSSSPAGLFSHLNVENGYGMMRGIGNGGYKNGDGYLAEGCGPAASRLKRQISFSSRQNSATSGLMSQISEMGSEGMSPGHEESSQCYAPGGFQTGSWDDSVLSDSYSGLKRSIDGKLVNGINQSEAQNGGLGSSDMATIEKLLQFQDSVPCKIRAKRGCATHPRSIAERVRRTRISERMRKLQELVPNMDKQTNTADMLDLAVEYIKDLQGQVKTLADDRASCTCSSSKPKPYSKPV